MKKKIFNGILLVAALFVTTSAFVSCKDNDADEITNAKIEIQKDLQTQLAALQSKIDAIKQCNCDNTEIVNKLKAAEDAITVLQNKLKAAEDAIEALQKKEPDLSGLATKEELAAATSELQTALETALEGVASKEEVTTAVNQLQTTIETALNDYATKEELEDVAKASTNLVGLLAASIEQMENALLQQVTSLNIDAVYNNVFGYAAAPIDVQTNMLIACYGTAESDVEFPVGSGEYINYAGDLLTLDEGNAGKLFVTINPSSVDFTGKPLTLESTAGNQAPVVLGLAKPSDVELQFGYGWLTRTPNAFYEVSAQIPAENLKEMTVGVSKQDLKELKEDIKVLLENRLRWGAFHVNNTIYNILAKNALTAYRLKANWAYGDKTYSTFSDAKIAAMAIKPLSYSFDPEGAITAEDLKKYEDKITGCFVEIGSGSSLEEAINKFWDKFNALVGDALSNVNYALQPCLLVQEGKKITRAAEINTYSGDIFLMPTSRSAEVFAPAYKKYVKVTCDGEEIEGELLSKVIDGNVLRIPLHLEPGKEYHVEYHAVDYTGVTRVREYTIYGE